MPKFPVFRFRLQAALAFLTAATPFAPCVAQSPPRLAALDGRLDEPVWREAVTLTQQSPKPGAPTPYETSVRVIVTADNLYFGFERKDPHPQSIAVHPSSPAQITFYDAI